MKKIIKNLLSVLLLIILTSNSLVALAAGAQSDFKEIKAKALEKIRDGAIAECQQTLVPAYDLELLDFLLFLEENFQNKSSNSSLTNIAITRYAKYKIALDDLFAELDPDILKSTNSNQYLAELGAYEACGKMKEVYINLAKEKMIDHIKNTAAQKKTFVMVEKYQGINNKLRKLNFSIAEMYSLFVSFQNKLPGFLQQCVQS